MVFIVAGTYYDVVSLCTPQSIFLNYTFRSRIDMTVFKLSLATITFFFALSMKSSTLSLPPPGFASPVVCEESNRKGIR